MTTAPRPIQVFIGSSTEGLRIARTLQSELESATGCTVNRWDTDVFAPGTFTLDALIQQARTVDFAILVATGDDTVTTRGAEMAAVRDNIILEFGMFLGALGRDRVYLLSVGDAKLPSDLLGLTRLIYRERSDRDIRAALNDAVLRTERAMEKLGPYEGRDTTTHPADGRPMAASITKDALANHSSIAVLTQEGTSQDTTVVSGKGSHDLTPSSLATVHSERAHAALEAEIQWLCSNATAQGWSVTKSNPTMLRLRSPKGREFMLTRKRPAGTRADLRKFVAELRANGLRINRALQGVVEDSPFG